MSAIANSAGRRAMLLGLAAALLGVRAEADVSVPPGLQAQLLAKVAAFDRNFPARAAGTALVLVVRRAGDDESARVAAGVAGGLDDLTHIGGVPRSVKSISYAGPTALVASLRANRPSIVYLAPGLEPEVPAIARALAGLDVLTVGASGAFAEAGANVGFDLEGSRPKIVVNLATCKLQGVSLKAELLKLARVVGS